MASLIENVGIFVFGALWGGALTGQVLMRKALNRRDALGDGMREQLRKVMFLSKFADQTHEVRSHAQVTTIDGEFEVHVIRKADA